MPAARSISAVPPVERIAIPKALKPRANATTPVLSETLISACLMTVIRQALPSASPSLDAVILHFLAQRVAINAEHRRRMRLVALDPVQHRFQQRFLDATDHHLIDGARFFAVKVLEIAVDRPADAARHLVLVDHAASSSS